ncbi:hypothetical protein GF327_09935 [Candidatus Woesearchaeota archaeon]|nr:hypothetical protein [Candidatus Woesearchaeota archaeon]
MVKSTKQKIIEELEKINTKNKLIIVEGKKLYSRLSSGLQRRGVIIDNSLRKKLYKITKLSQIEGLFSYVCSIK